MTPSLRAAFAAIMLLLATAQPAHAAHITFTGGTFTTNDGWAGMTANFGAIANLANYREDDFVFLTPLAQAYAGDYHAVSNDVLHSEWAADAVTGSIAIYGYQESASAFDLNGFSLVSNSATPYGNARGSERVYLHASLDGANASYRVLLPVEDWGFPGSAIVLGAEFKNIKAFWFTADRGVGFGIDDVFIDEPAPGQVPEPGALALVGVALAGLIARRRRSRAAVDAP